MIPVRVLRGELEGEGPEALASRLVGLIAALEVRGSDGSRIVSKGTVLAPDDVEVLLEAPWEELHLLEMEEGELHEEPAGGRLARAVAGGGIRVGAFGGGHWPLGSEGRGILEVDADVLARVNELEGLCVYTHYSGRVLEEGDTVGRAKIIPFAVAGDRLSRAEEILGDEGAIRVRRFRPTRVAAVVQESLGEEAMVRFRKALGEKLAWFGSTLDTPRFVAPRHDRVARALKEVVEGGADLVVMAGIKAMDRLDPAFVALESVGARLEFHGVPAHPGSLFWMARMEGVPVVGMPTCGLFSRATVFDLVLPRLLAGIEVDARAMAALGHGGFLTGEQSWRFPPYRKAGERGEVE